MFFKTHELNVNQCNQCGNAPSDSCNEKLTFDISLENLKQNSPETFMHRSYKKPKPNQIQETEKLEKRNKNGYIPDSMCTFRLICHSLCYITCRSLKREYF